MIAWIITIPASATVAALFYLLASGETALTLAGLDLIALVGLGAFAWRETKLQSGSPMRIWAMMAVLGIVTAAAIVMYGLAD
jgi:PiT family inorganic phosphate transporter